MNRPEKEGPLKGITIIDLTRLLPGPLATQLLADMGADVIKFENIISPDYARFMPPQYNGVGLTFLSVNRSKRSLAVDLNSEEGKNIFWDVLKTADIVIDSFRPGVMEKIGIDYESAKKVKEDIIYVSITGYGYDSPLSNKAGHDINYLGRAGILSTNGKPDEIIQPGVQISDIAGGSYPTVMACLSAIISKHTTGKGQHVDVAMVDCSVPLLSIYMGEVLNSQKTYQRQEHVLAGSIPNYNIYQCKDGKWISLGALEPKFWKGFCELLQKPDWIAKMFDPSMKEVLKALFLEKDRDEWVQFAENSDICLTGILEMDELESDEYLQNRKMFVEHVHPAYGKFKNIAQPIKYNGNKKNPGWAAPMLGEDNTDILKSLGYSDEKIAELKKKGKIV
ncbi:MAG: CoA transferase [Chitinophagales bacterium]|nr:CoA transferase [Chitinophagales bacterium]